MMGAFDERVAIVTGGGIGGGIGAAASKGVIVANNADRYLETGKV